MHKIQIENLWKKFWVVLKCPLIFPYESLQCIKISVMIYIEVYIGTYI